MAIKVNMAELPDKHDKPVCLSKDFHAESLLPSPQDLCILVARILTEDIAKVCAKSNYNMEMKVVS